MYETCILKQLYLSYVFIFHGVVCFFPSLCLSLTDLSERQAALAVREGEMERECLRREEGLRRAVVTQATQKQ